MSKDVVALARSVAAQRRVVNEAEQVSARALEVADRANLVYRSLIAGVLFSLLVVTFGVVVLFVAPTGHGGQVGACLGIGLVFTVVTGAVLGCYHESDSHYVRRDTLRTNDRTVTGRKNEYGNDVGASFISRREFATYCRQRAESELDQLTELTLELYEAESRETATTDLDVGTATEKKQEQRES